MAAPAYSINLATAPSVNTPLLVGSPPAGYVWVARDCVMTVGSYLGFVVGGFGYSEVGPWVLIQPPEASQIIGIHKQSWQWTGRVVFNENQQLWLMVESPDTADFMLMGYQLSVSGHF